MIPRPGDGEEEEAIQIIVDHPTRSILTEPLWHLVRTAVDEQEVKVVSLSIVLTDRKTVHDLNRDYLGHDYPTDVVAFPLSDEPEAQGLEGEVYVDLDTAVERAPEFNTDPVTEAYRYAIHGTLHLLGYEDGTEEEREAMRRREDELLAGR